MSGLDAEACASESHPNLGDHPLSVVCDIPPGVHEHEVSIEQELIASMLVVSFLFWGVVIGEAVHLDDNPGGYEDVDPVATPGSESDFGCERPDAALMEQPQRTALEHTGVRSPHKSALAQRFSERSDPRTAWSPQTLEFLFQR